MDYSTYVFIPLLIVVARVLDVSLGTMRVIFISKGYKFGSAVLGFLEILIWLFAIEKILTNLTNPVAFLAYAVGFSLGTYVGIVIDEKLSVGKVVLRIITKKDDDELVDNLKKTLYSVTTVEGEGRSGPVKVIYMVINRKDIKKMFHIIDEDPSKPFYTIEDIRFGSEETIPSIKNKASKTLSRKSK